MALARFHDNPWPDGHAVTTLAWTARLDGLGVWFDLHLETDAYDALAAPRVPEVLDGDPWRLPGPWLWARSATLSSTMFAAARGVLVATPQHPLRTGPGTAYTFVADRLDERHQLVRPAAPAPLPEAAPPRPRAFGAHILGRDLVAGHDITLTRRLDDDAAPGSLVGAWSLVWTGRLASPDHGVEGFDRTFEVTEAAIGLSSVQVEGDVDAPTAEATLRACLPDLPAMRIQRSIFGHRFLPA